jgi:hypothetical protein
MSSSGGAAPRRRRQRGARFAGAPVVLALLALAPDAHAYIDPGTGSLILQGLIAGLAAAAVVIRGYWYRIKAFFRGDKAAAAKPDPETRRPGDPE